MARIFYDESGSFTFEGVKKLFDSVKLSKATGKDRDAMRENLGLFGDDDIYVISVDDFDRFRDELRKQREQNNVIVAKEKDGLVTMQFPGVTFHVASDIFKMVKEFWDYEKPRWKG